MMSHKKKINNLICPTLEAVEPTEANTFQNNIKCKIFCGKINSLRNWTFSVLFKVLSV